MGITTAHRQPQSDQRCYITVGTDHRGSATWLVVAPDQVIRCSSGNRAVAVLEALITSGRCG
jgi:hypothetical protein